MYRLFDWIALKSRPNRRVWPWLALALAAGVFWLANLRNATPAPSEKLPAVVDFNWHIRPILSDRCFTCHGPDEKKRQAGLRLDTKTGALAPLDSLETRFAIVPGRPEKSELVRRIHAAHPDTVMPPSDSHLTLTDFEKKLLVRWIEQGAPWSVHWAYIPPKRPAVPQLRRSGWGQYAVDAFILEKMQEHGLSPAPEADRPRLLRRASFALTGLPPSPALAERFLADDRPDAYERLLDTLLASPAYGERWAMTWLDLARYADTHGYQDDLPRTMWPWRDWVIKAFNENMPVDRFVGWQLAGDLEPGATKEMLLASAFNRNHKITQEGGVIDEEYRVEYVADRTNTFGKAFLGLTLECARCHDHKYDPVSMREYYGAYAFFNQVPENGFVPNLQTPQPYMVITAADLDGPLAFLNAGTALQKPEDTLRQMIMRDSAGMRQTRRLHRGQYDQPLEPVPFATPAAILPFDTAHWPQNRLGLAQWLFDARNPLTARVWVNRLWQEVFGRGIVFTAENFGVQGALPTHPELLDWLAVEFCESGWDQKHILRLLLQSATFRQSAVASARQQTADPENRWLSRSARIRMPYEFIRDNVLASSGLLNTTIGGPSAKPWQPPGIWEEISTEKSANGFRGEYSYLPDTLPGRMYRRSVYTYQRRTIPPPTHLSFDAPVRDNCEVRRTRSNTPLQALVLLNDRQVLEAARVLAGRLLHHALLESAEKRLREAFRRILTREAGKKELRDLMAYFSAERERFRKNPAAARQLLAVGDYPAGASGDPAEQAALMLAVCVLYNLDEAVTL
ncbi:MAG: PSD1 domain-containing protein [Saprospirales bacterium]|nr:PSD1 domain-containing protein [Saprospirales bacterium]